MKTPRLPGAEAAFKIGRADITFKAPVQASGDDFTLTHPGPPPRTSEQRSLFDDDAPPDVAAFHLAPHEVFLSWTEDQQREYCARRDRDSAQLETDQDTRAFLLARAHSDTRHNMAGDIEKDLLTIAIEDVVDEITRAMRKFPTWPTDPIHAAAIIGEEFGELMKAVVQQTYEPHKNKPNELREEAIHCAAMAVRFVMSLDAYEVTPCHHQ